MAVTENLGLQVFSSDGSDSFLSFWQALAGKDQNSNMEIIDAAVKALQDALTGLAADIPAETPVATTETAGRVKPDGVTILVDTDGKISAQITLATTEKAGAVLPDNTTIKIVDGKITATFPVATVVTPGLVRPDNETILIDKDGVIRSAAKVDIATTDTAGIVKPDGKSIVIAEDGTISSTVDDAYTKAEMDAMLQQLSDMLMTENDLEILYAAVNTLMGEDTEFTGLGASLLKVNALADELLA